MFARITRRKNRDGSTVAYMQVVHTYRTPGEPYPRSKVLFGLGRVDRDADQMRALATGILRHLEADDVRASIAEAKVDDAVVLEPDEDGRVVAQRFEARKVGVELLLWAMWKKTGLHDFFLERSPERGARHSKLAFLVVLNRALDPRSKNALPGWAESEIWCDNARELVADDFYDVLDVVAEHDEQLQRRCFVATCELTGDSAATACYDTSSSYFEMTESDVDIAKREAAWASWEAGDGSTPPPDVRRPQVVNIPPMRMRGYSRDHRPDLPQTVIGLATTERGLPMRSWVFPGNTTDAKTVIDVQQDLAAVGVRDVVFVGDRGMTSAQNINFFESENVKFVLGKKLRDGDASVMHALATAGPMQQVDEDREYLTVAHPEHPGRQLVVVRNPARARHDERVREALAQRASERADAVNASSSDHPRAACELTTTTGLSRLLERDGEGKLRLSAAALAREARLDGITVLETNAGWSPERAAEAYQALLHTEDGWRTLKSTESLRPVHHRRADRIRAHVTLSTVALALIRTVEHLTGRTWRRVVDELATLHRIRFEAGGREHVTTSVLTHAQREIYDRVGAESPARTVHRGWAV